MLWSSLKEKWKKTYYGKEPKNSTYTPKTWFNIKVKMSCKGVEYEKELHSYETQ